MYVTFTRRTRYDTFSLCTFQLVVDLLTRYVWRAGVGLHGEMRRLCLIETDFGWKKKKKNDLHSFCTYFIYVESLAFDMIRFQMFNALRDCTVFENLGVFELNRRTIQAPRVVIDKGDIGTAGPIRGWNCECLLRFPWAPLWQRPQ